MSQIVTDKKDNRTVVARTSLLAVIRVAKWRPNVKILIQDVMEDTMTLPTTTHLDVMTIPTGDTSPPMRAAKRAIVSVGLFILVLELTGYFRLWTIGLLSQRYRLWTTNRR